MKEETAKPLMFDVRFFRLRLGYGATAEGLIRGTGRSEVVLCLSWAIIGERLHFGIRSFGFRRGPRAITLAIRRKLNRRKPLTFILIYL
jgi:hypothetical protein